MTLKRKKKKETFLQDKNGHGKGGKGGEVQSELLYVYILTRQKRY